MENNSSHTDLESSSDISHKTKVLITSKSSTYNLNQGILTLLFRKYSDKCGSNLDCLKVHHQLVSTTFDLYSKWLRDVYHGKWDKRARREFNKTQKVYRLLDTMYLNVARVIVVPSTKTKSVDDISNTSDSTTSV